MKLAGLIALATASLVADVAAAQQTINLRGTIASFDGRTIAVETFDGRKLNVAAPADLRVSTTRPFSLAEIKPGMVLGVTTGKAPNGDVVAIDVRPIPATANQGLSPWDLQPGSTMTNGVVEASVASTNGPELTLNYKTGSVKVMVPPEATLSQAAPGAVADIKPGETIFLAARDENGALTALRAQVSKDGVKPTQ